MINQKNFKYIYNEIKENKYDFGTGSWAVVNDKVKMNFNQFGEYVSSINSSEIEELSQSEIESLRKTSMLLSDENESDIAEELFSEVPNIKYDNRLGYYSSLYVGHVLEGTYRENGSSGGFGTWLLKELLEKKIVDGVIHVKESNQENKLFEYGISNTIDEIIAGAKTKYYPVEYSEVLKKVLTTPGKYAIIGLPSYIMELRLLAKENPLLKEKIKISIGLVCGHQKSTKFAEFLAWQCGIKPGNLKNINFRKKQNDEPSSSYAIEVTGIINGHEKTIIKKMSELKGGDWGQGFFKVRASDFTDDVMNETADVTLGDAWLKEYVTDTKGNNILIVRNPIVKSIIDEGIKNGIIKVNNVDSDTIFKSQEAHFRQTQDELKYRLYKKEKNEIWHPRKRVNSSNELSWSRKRIQDKREKICDKVPLIYEKAVKKDNINYFLRKSGLLS